MPEQVKAGEGEERVSIPPDLYGADDGDVAWYPGGTRGQAVAVAAGFWGADFTALRACRCYSRVASAEEKIERGWGEDDGICVLGCGKDHPEAVAGWEIEDHS